MPGVRIHHPELRNVVFAIEHPTRRLGLPWFCPTCRKAHVVKTYHIRLDAEGDAIVSEQVYRRLLECGGAGFTLENEVKKPPAITLDFNGQAARFRVVEKRLERRENG